FRLRGGFGGSDRSDHESDDESGNEGFHRGFHYPRPFFATIRHASRTDGAPEESRQASPNTALASDAAPASASDAAQAAFDQLEGISFSSEASSERNATRLQFSSETAFAHSRRNISPEPFMPERLQIAPTMSVSSPRRSAISRDFEASRILRDFKTNGFARAATRFRCSASWAF